MNRLVMFDLDGTLIESRREDGWNRDMNDVVWIEDAFRAIGLLHSVGAKMAIVTSQPCEDDKATVERGSFIREVVKWIGLASIARYTELDPAILPVYACYHHKQRGCSCRKPNPGLIDEAIGSFEYSEHWMIGDKWSDMLAAQDCDFIVKTCMVNEWGYRQKGSTPLPDWIQPPDIYCSNILDAAKIIASGVLS